MNLTYEILMYHLFTDQYAFTDNTCDYKLCTPVNLEVGGLSHGTLLPLTVKTSLNANLVDIFNSTRVTCRSSLTNP